MYGYFLRDFPSKEVHEVWVGNTVDGSEIRKKTPGMCRNPGNTQIKIPKLNW